MVKRYLSLTSFDEALSLLKSTFPGPGRTEIVPVIRALGRAVAQPVYARYAVPEVNLAAMDGIAVKSRDTIGASEQHPVTLGQAARVNTGNVLPEGFDAVIMIEDTWEVGDKFQIRKSASPWQHVRPAGEDIREGRLVLPKGHVVRAFDIGALATYGITEIESTTAGVGIIPTGSELVPLGVHPRPGQVVESNTIMAQVLLESMGASCTRLPIVRDDPTLIEEALRAAATANDLVIISAGSSAGTRDFTAGAIAAVGELIFHGVAVKPGKPMMLGKISGTPVIGLPGYPLAAQTVLREFAVPLLEHWGLAPFAKHVVRARLATPLASDLGFDEFVPVSVGRIGTRHWGIARSRSAVVQMSTVRSNGYAHIPARIEGYDAEHELDVFLTTDPANIERTLLFSGAIDPVLEELGNLAHDRGLFIHTANAGNTSAILSLKRNACHAAPMSLPAFSLLRENATLFSLLESMDLVFVNIATREQGIVSSKGVSPDTLDTVCWVNSGRDTPARLLFDTLLASHHLSPAQVRGYTTEAATPGAIAAAVQAGQADAGICSEGLATSHGLRFFPLAKEQYELVMRREMLGDPRIISLISLVQGREFKAQLERTGAYHTALTGRIRSLSSDTSDIDIPSSAPPSVIP
ncbi:molybdenum cofactor synthesis domain [Methanoregula boonei 6A8]|uniref:Molybdenum cofactor synthesis domain n=1 Tax=Methanoregula boonei (strain DSM 21154 / JCM 14090 / 6A8) TaxID=456442 RepID=A7I7W3_METB6|nr:molybdopterin biosynthesis protein [Methanoregula boonei]ABS55824.1 molybdenum cofactor synthesis domain [Methanoregula boonei 6A8]